MMNRAANSERINPTVFSAPNCAGLALIGRSIDTVHRCNNHVPIDRFAIEPASIRPVDSVSVKYVKERRTTKNLQRFLLQQGVIGFDFPKRSGTLMFLPEQQLEGAVGPWPW